jgi:hypothetical protein
MAAKRVDISKSGGGDDRRSWVLFHPATFFAGVMEQAHIVLA